MSNRFHNKFHRHNHHTRPTDRTGQYPDSAYDPIASPDAPFRGEFYVDGNITTLSSISVAGNLNVQGGSTQLNTLVHITSAVDILTNTDSPALTITQTGNGYALRINDSTNTDASPFAVDKDGHVIVSVLSAKNAYELVNNVSNPSFFLATLSAQGNDSGLYVKSVNGIPFYVEDGSGNDSTPFIIDKDGKVGVGVKYPSEALTVAGNISASGNISSDKQFLFAEGSVSAPSVANKDKNYFLLQEGTEELVIDTSSTPLVVQEFANNGIYIPSADALGFVTNSIDRLRITQSGNVGIGTTTPNQKLTVSGNISANGYGYVKGLHTIESPFNGSSEGGQLTLMDPTSIGGWEIDNNDKTLRFFRDKISPTVIGMVILSDGNVGIGATTPNEKLTVNGNINASGNISSDKQFLFANGSVSAPSVANKDSNYFLLQEGTGPLYLEGGTDSLLIQEYGNTGFYIPSTDSLGFVTNGTEKVRITQEGKVGIGTTTPNTNLTVVGNISATGGLTVEGSVNGVVKGLQESHPVYSAETLYCEQLMKGVIVASSTGPYTLTLDTATGLNNSYAAFFYNTIPTGAVINFTLLNTATNTVTIAVSTGITLKFGSGAVSANTSKRFCLIKTTASTFDLYAGV